MGRAPVYFSETMTIGPNTYLIEVKRSQRGQKYFLITKTNARPGEDQAVLVFSHFMGRFVKMVERAAATVYHSVPEIEPLERSWVPKPAKRSKLRPTVLPKRPQEPLPKTTASEMPVEKDRREYANAYLPWTKQDDAKLTFHFQDGIKIAELATIFQRKPSAIRSRLKRLGLTP